jgi:soluble P-type ATPase
MIEIDVPGYKTLQLSHLVLDHNGTLAVDGALLPGVGDCLRDLAADLRVHVLTADTFGRAQEELDGLPLSLTVMPEKNQDTGKLAFVRELGAWRCVCIGNGRNDRMMLSAAALGIAVILGEGAAFETIAAADVVAVDIVSALSLLRHPLRLTATLRS